MLPGATGTPVLHFRKAGVVLDWIEGPVTDVVDGDTFDLRVEWVGKSNRNKYGNQERVRLAGVNAPEINTPAGQIAKDRLRGQIAGRFVRCDVQARDTFGRLVCDVKVVPRRRSA